MGNDGQVQQTTPTPPAPPSDAERMREESVRRLLANSSLLAHLSDIVSIVDRRLRFVYVSRAFEGRSESELLGTNFLERMSPPFRDHFRAAFEQVWATGSPRTIEYASGHQWWETRLVPIEADESVPLMFLTSAIISERKRREQELSERESRLRYAMEASGVGTWTWDRATDEISWDDGLCRIYGLDPKKSPRRYEEYVCYLHPEDRPRIEAQIGRCVETGVYEDFEHRVIRPEGEVRHVFCRGVAVLDDAGVVTGMRGGIFDVTDRKRLEEQLRHVQKMEAIGQLAAGIAHNFNNLLSIVLPNVELCRAQAPVSVHGRLADIEHAATRATEMVRQLMLFARHEIGASKGAADLVAIADRTVSICRATFDRRISIELTAERDLPPVLARAGEIEQVLLNICINARDALEESSNDNPRIAISIGRGSAHTLSVCVRDNGPGIDEVTRARLFEPFFTTKDVGRGTGLGLASAYGIVVDHDGHIACQSELGVGTSFTIELPIAGEISVVPLSSAPPPASRGSETILFVDDEPLVRKALGAVLEEAGFRVLEAADGREGLMQIERRDVTIDLVLLDRSMPRMSGEQFMRELRSRHPKMPVVLLTGHPGSETELEGAFAVMMKPPRSAALLATIRELLDEADDKP
jgi:two-component system, cell cycle sensor histidine kinase and response regulator CckA